MSTENDKSITHNKLSKKRRLGRPTIYSTMLAEEVCKTISSSTKGTKRLCAENQHWPCQDTLFSWLKEHTEFSEQYRQAKQHQAEILADELLDIADDDTKDLLLTENGVLKPNQTALNRAKLKIDTRKWLIAKLLPKVYGSYNRDDSSSTQLKHEDWVRILEEDNWGMGKKT